MANANVLIDGIMDIEGIVFKFTCNSRIGIKRATVTRIEIDPVRINDKMTEKLRFLPAGDQSRRSPGINARTMPEN